MAAEGESRKIRTFGQKTLAIASAGDSGVVMAVEAIVANSRPTRQHDRRRSRPQARGSDPGRPATIRGAGLPTRDFPKTSRSASRSVAHRSARRVVGRLDHDADGPASRKGPGCSSAKGRSFTRSVPARRRCRTPPRSRARDGFSWFGSSPGRFCRSWSCFEGFRERETERLARPQPFGAPEERRQDRINRTVRRAPGPWRRAELSNSRACRPHVASVR
jgi:hypothetical protein